MPCDSRYGAPFRLLHALPSYARGISAALGEARFDISTYIGATSAGNEVAVKKCQARDLSGPFIWVLNGALHVHAASGARDEESESPSSIKFLPRCTLYHSAQE